MKQLNLGVKMPDTLFGMESSLIKILFLPIPLIIGFLISLNLVVMPKIDEINETNKKIVSVQDQTKLVIDKKNYLKSINKEQIKKDAEYLNSALLDERQSYFLVGVIRSIADEYGFQVKSFSIAPGKLKKEDNIKIADKDVMKKIPLDIVVIGPKNGYLDLLLGLEKSLPILIIDRFNIAALSDVAELELGISSYYIADKAGPNITNLSISDLTLKKEESELLNKLSQFKKIEASSTILVASDSGKLFQKYQRPNPFSL